MGILQFSYFEMADYFNFVPLYMESFSFLKIANGYNPSNFGSSRAPVTNI